MARLCLLCFLPVYLVYALPRVPQYEPYDIKLTCIPTDNPYVAYRLWADFSGPNGEFFQAEGFWNGGTEWIIRVALPVAGLWNYTTHATDPLLDQKSGTIECTASNNRGFVYQSGRHFYYEDGTPFLRLGDTCWRLYRSKNVPFETHFKPYVDARAEQGFNYIIGVIHTLGDPSINEGGSLWENDTDLNRLRPEYFAWVDKRVQYMVERGIVPGILFVWADTFDDFYQPPYDRDTFSRFRRYIVARYWAYNVFWIISGEYSETMSAHDYDYHGEHITFGNDYADSGIYDIGDPYGHPISIHPGGQQSTSQDYPFFSDWLSFTMQQHYGSPRYLHGEILKDYTLGLPVCNDEFGYEGPTDPNDPLYEKSNQSARDARKDAWTLVCAGAYFTFGNLYTFTGKEYKLDLNHLYSPGAHYMGILGEYMRNNVNYTTMQPDQGLVLSDGVYCLARRGQEYLFYFPHDGAYDFTLDAPDFVFDAHWLNPETGETFEDAVCFGDRVHKKTTPFPDDAVLHIYNPCDASLSVELVSFSAVKVDSVIHLEWSTKTETNTAGFVIQRASLQQPFVELASFAAHPALRSYGSATAGHTYSFIDATIESGADYDYRLLDIDLDGRQTIHASVTLNQTSVANPQNKSPQHIKLFQNYPNPFNRSTVLSFFLPTPQPISLLIYNARGQKVWHTDRDASGGINTIAWHGLDMTGSPVSSGLYFYELRAGQTLLRHKLLILE